MLRLAKIQLEVLLATVLKVRKVFTGDQVQDPYANHQNLENRIKTTK